MADKQIKSITFPDLPDRYTFLQSDTTLTQSGKAADAKVVGDMITGLEGDISQTKEEGTVPTSEQMLSDNYTEDSVPYHFRKTASDNANREELEVVGGSVAFNQLFVTQNKTSSNITISKVDNAAINIAGTSVSGQTWLQMNSSGALVEGHKYFVDKGGDSQMFALNNDNKGVNTGYANRYTIGNCSQNSYMYVLIKQTEETLDINAKPMICDLTVMFGSTIADHIYTLEQATAGAGVALFKSLFPKGYYPYDAGSMQNVSGLSEHKTVGFNQFNKDDPTIVDGKVINENGVAVNASNYFYSEYIPVLPNTEYYVGNFITTGGMHCGGYYDENKNFISQISILNDGDRIKTTPSNCHYIIVCAKLVDKERVCINLSDTAKNGTYEPYDGHSYALDDSLTLRGIPALVDGKIKWDGDVYSADGSVKRRYVEHTYNGSENWQTSGSAYYIDTADLANGTTQVFSTYLHNSSWSAITQGTDDNGITAYKISSWAKGRVGIRASAYATVADWKTHLASNPLTVVYALGEPTTEQADPYVSPQTCHYDGTEEFVSTGIVPIGHNTKYPDNLRMKLDNLPWNFASLIAPTESGFKATRNYSIGDLVIVNNVLYEVTANIANNGTITVGVNVDDTTLAEYIANHLA